VFLKGCPLRCRWCHNPEGILATPHLSYNDNKCSLRGRCVAKCPTGALGIVGHDVTVKEAIDEVLLDKKYYKSDGGVTFSGGEPAIQPEFLLALIQTADAERLHIIVETSGHAPLSTFLAIVPYKE